MGIGVGDPNRPDAHQYAAWRSEVLASAAAPRPDRGPPEPTVSVYTFTAREHEYRPLARGSGWRLCRQAR